MFYLYLDFLLPGFNTVSSLLATHFHCGVVLAYGP